MAQTTCKNWPVALTIGLLVMGLESPVLAQITPDETLGEERSVVTPGVPVRGSAADRIDGGARRGANLFHSFQEFNVNDGQRVYFANPAGVENILGRVTGADVSDIMGTLGVDGGANLFLLNPNGIVFGPNARLNVRGSFIATTGNGFTFPDGSEFSAINPQAPSLLTVSAPVGVQFGGAPGSITTRGDESLGDVISLNTLTLLGGEILVDNAELFSLLGGIELGAATVGTVNLVQNGNQFRLSFPDATERANISIVNGGRLGIFSEGSIAITAQNLNISESLLVGANLLGNPDRQSGDIILNTINETIIGQNSTVRNVPGEGGGGNIRITTGSLSVADGSRLRTETTGLLIDEESSSTSVDAGSIIINARDAVSFRNSIASTEVGTGASGNAGNIEINTNTLELINDRSIPSIVDSLSANTRGQGDAGSIIINARDSVLLDGGKIASSIVRDAIGDGGNIEINTQTLTLQNSFNNASNLFVIADGNGNGGDIIIRSDDSVSMNGSVIYGIVDVSGNGNAGDIEITTNNLSINGSQIQSQTNSRGNAGNVRITSDSTSLNESAIFSSVVAGAVGDSGNVEITANDLSVNESQILLRTNGRGDAGDLRINGNLISFNESVVFNDVFAGAVGSGGNVEITTNSLLLNNSSFVSATGGQGNAGNININARDSVLLDRSTMFSQISPGGVGNAGNIEIAANSLTSIDSGIISGVRDRDEVNRLAAGRGRAGNIIINTADSAYFSGGGVYANSSGEGTSGDIRINTGFLRVEEGAQLYTSNEGQGNAGNVNINASNRVIVDGVGGLPNFERSSSIFSSAEDTSSGRGGSIIITTPSFLVTNSGVVNARTRNSERGGNILINANIFEAYNGGQIITTTSGAGTAGDITLNIANNTVIAGVDSNFSTYELYRVDTQEGNTRSGLYADAARNSTGRGGSINITTGQLNVQDSAQVVVSSQGSGQAGNLTVSANSATFENQASLAAETLSSSGGSINLQIVDSLRLENNSQISASTQTGQGGNIQLNRDRTPANSVQLSGNSSLSAQATGTGNAGGVALNTQELGLQDRSSITAATTSGQGGNIALTGLNNLRVNNGAISASTTSGQAGGVTVNATDSIVLDGAEANVAVRAEGGAAGSLTVNTGQLTLQNGAQATVSNTGVGTAGNLDVTARRVQLENQARLTAETEAASSGGNINLRVSDSLQLNNNSQISASTQTGQGGNVRLNSDRPPTNTVELAGNSRLTAQASSSGNAGDIVLNTEELTVRGNSNISASTTSGQGGDITLRGLDQLRVNNGEISASTSTGQAGSLRIDANESVRLNNGRLAVQATNGGSAGSLSLNTQELSLQDGSQVTVSSAGSGRSGEIEINAQDVELRSGSAISASTENGRGGSLSIQNRQNPTRSIAVRGNSRIETEATGTGNAGNLTLDAQQIAVTNGGLISAATQSGRGGDIDLQNLERLQVNNGRISASTQTGEAGNLRVDAAEGTVRLSGSQSDGRPSGLLVSGEAGIGGTLTIIAAALEMQDNAQISASTTSGRGGSISLQNLETLRVSNSEISASTETGQAGNLTVNASESIDLRNRGRLAVEATAGGDAGNLDLTTEQLTLRGGSEVTVSSRDTGTAGNINVNAAEISLNQSSLTANTEAGSGGDVNLRDVETLTLQNGSIVAATTQDGQGGRVRLNVNQSPAERVQLSSGSRITTAATGDGQAGNIRLNTEELVVQGSIAENRANSQRSGQQRVRSRTSAITATSRSNRGGSIQIEADRAVIQNQGRIAASTQTGRAGNLVLEADSVQLSNQGSLTVAARDRRGRAGNLTVESRALSLEDGSTIAASNISDRPANPQAGGNITLRGLETLEVENSRISASTQTGRAGSLTVNAEESITLNNGRLLVQATEAGGRAGGVSLATDRLTARNSQVSVSSNQGRAGNLAVDADAVILNDGSLTAQAGRGSGAEVTLENLDLLYLQNNSEISARATNQANGGNVTIDAANGFIVSPLGADSDIIANAAEGRGGNIQITTEGIFGITEGRAIAGNGTNDIDASSEAGVQGSVTINQPTTDPSRGLTELPSDVVDAANQVNQVCPTGNAAAREPSEFVVTGRGGLPANPEDALNGETLLADWVTLSEPSTPVALEPEPIPEPSAPLVEAQGWRRGANGEVIFTAQAAAPSSDNSEIPHCP